MTAWPMPFLQVMFTFVPHVPVFFTWLIGFGLIFWTILYKVRGINMGSVIIFTFGTTDH